MRKKGKDGGWGQNRTLKFAQGFFKETKSGKFSPVYDSSSFSSKGTLEAIRGKENEWKWCSEDDAAWACIWLRFERPFASPFHGMHFSIRNKYFHCIKQTLRAANAIVYSLVLVWNEWPQKSCRCWNIDKNNALELSSKVPAFRAMQMFCESKKEMKWRTVPRVTCKKECRRDTEGLPSFPIYNFVVAFEYGGKKSVPISSE